MGKYHSNLLMLLNFDLAFEMKCKYVLFISRNSDNYQVVDTALIRAHVVCEVVLV